MRGLKELRAEEKAARSGDDPLHDVELADTRVPLAGGG
jgi:hypothetical protein